MADVGDILRATLRGVMLDSVQFNLVHTYRVITGTELDYTAIAVAIETQLETGYTALEAELHDSVISDDLTLAEWDFTDNEFDGKALVLANALIGADVAEAYPGGIGVLMRWPTEELRRQGRKFVPGVHETNAQGNNIGAATVAAAATSAAILNNTFAAGALLLHPCTFNVDPTSPRFETSSLFSVTDFFVNLGPGYQRNRQPGAGI